jgi:uncharacterized protein
MSPMAKPLKGFLLTLALGWAALYCIGVEYARFLGVPTWRITGPVLAAFLIEFPFYLVPAFPAIREKLAGMRLPWFLLAASALPYLALCCGAVPFQWLALGRLAAVSAAIGLWYLALPPKPLVDLGFGVFIGWLLLGGYLDPAYPPPYPKVAIVYLGKLAVFQAAILALMLARRAPETGYGFIPTWREWRIGVLHFLGYIVVALPLALALKAVKLGPSKPLWLIVGTFLGMLWVLSLAEEYFFRGVLQGMLERAFSNRWAALAATSVAFGLVHLPFGHAFPNWRWVLLAGILGLFCGHARNQAGGIRAGMVTHALVVTAWKAFFVTG